MSIIAISGKIGSGKDTIGNIIQYLVENNNRLLADKISFDFFKLNKEVRIVDYDKSSSWQIKKFADSTTKSFEIITGINYHNLNKEEKEKVRPTYIKYAEGCKEIFTEEIWVNSLMREYEVDIDIGFKVKWDNSLLENNIYKDRNGKTHIAKYPNWIITDLRFPNELEAVKSRGGITIRINRPRFCSNCPLTNLESQDCFDCVVYQDDYLNFHKSEIELDNSEFDYVIDNNSNIISLIEKVKDILIKEQIL